MTSTARQFSDEQIVWIVQDTGASHDNSYMTVAWSKKRAASDLQRYGYQQISQRHRGEESLWQHEKTGHQLCLSAWLVAGRHVPQTRQDALDRHIDSLETIHTELLNAGHLKATHTLAFHSIIKRLKAQKALPPSASPED